MRRRNARNLVFRIRENIPKKVVVSVKYFLHVSYFLIEIPDIIIQTDPAMGKALCDLRTPYATELGLVARHSEYLSRFTATVLMAANGRCGCHRDLSAGPRSISVKFSDASHQHGDRQNSRDRRAMIDTRVAARPLLISESTNANIA